MTAARARQIVAVLEDLPEVDQRVGDVGVAAPLAARVERDRRARRPLGGRQVARRPQRDGAPVQRDRARQRVARGAAPAL